MAPDLREYKLDCGLRSRTNAALYLPLEGITCPAPDGVACVFLCANCRQICAYDTFLRQINASGELQQGKNGVLGGKSSNQYCASHNLIAKRTTNRSSSTLLKVSHTGCL